MGGGAPKSGGHILWQEPSRYASFTTAFFRAARVSPLPAMTIKPRDVRFEAQYRFDPTHVPDQSDDLTALFLFRQHLRTLSPHLQQWFLAGNSKNEAFLHEAFDDDGPASALLAVLSETEWMKKKTSLATVRSVGLWNGEDNYNGASMGVLFRDQGGPCIASLENSCPDIISHEAVLSVLMQMVKIWNPLFVSAAPIFYDSVFNDRPGVGWMLYLPKVLSAGQVPEARALVPVHGADKKQIGTIIVSVTDEPFSEQNPEHVKVANAIEVRLAGQDLPPRFTDL